MTNFHRPNKYPIDAFHNIVRDAAYEVGRHMQAPEALVGNAFLSAMSVACQRHVDVELLSGQVRPVSLNIATVAESGERKTSVDSLVCAPIYQHDTKKMKACTTRLASYRADMHFWNTVDDALQQRVRRAVKGGHDLDEVRDALVAHSLCKPTKPTSQRTICQSITGHAFMDALRGDGKSVAIMSDEGEIVLKGGAMESLGWLNKAWDGAKVLVLDRAHDHVEVTNPRVTISFMVQAGAFEKFMEKGGHAARASGHLARYLVAYPESTQGTRYTSLEPPEWDALPAFHHRVVELLEAPTETQRVVLSFSAEARERWVSVLNDVERRLGASGDLSGIRDFASKSMEIVSRAAAIFHHFSAQAGTTISLETLERALEVVGWYLDEFRRLFGDPNDEPQVTTDARKVLRYLYTHVWCCQHNEVPRNDVRQCGPVRKRGRFENALDQLCRDGSIAVGRINGRQKLFIHLNPNVFNQLAIQ